VPIGGGNGNLIIAQLDQYRAFLPSEMYFPGNIAVAPESIGKGPIEDAQAVYSRIPRGRHQAGSRLQQSVGIRR